MFDIPLLNNLLISFNNVFISLIGLKTSIKKEDSCKFKHIHKKQIVWKHGPNWPFYALMLRTKLY